MNGGQAGTKSTSDVLEALSVAWRLTLGDFLQLWLLTLIPVAVITITFFVGGAIPCVGMLISLLALALVKPQFLAGYFAALTREVDGEPLDFNDLFSGYRERLVQSLVAMLPVYGVWLAGSVLSMLVVGFLAFGTTMLQEAMYGPGKWMLFPGSWGIAGLLGAILYIVLGALFLFVPLAVWDHEESGWEAFLSAARLSMAHIGQAVAFTVLAGLIYLVAAVLGMLLLCVGVVVTIPFATAWLGLALVLLYRGWTGREDAPTVPRATAPAPPAPPPPPAPEGPPSPPPPPEGPAQP